MKKWTKESAERYIAKAKEKGLTYWSAVDYLKHHKSIRQLWGCIIQVGIKKRRNYYVSKSNRQV